MSTVPPGAVFSWRAPREPTITYGGRRADGMVTAMPERTPDLQVIPYLLYADAGAAMDWLIKTFAFTGRVRDRRTPRRR